MLFAAKTDENGEIRSRTKEEEDEIHLKLREDRRDFQIRFVFAYRQKKFNQKMQKKKLILLSTSLLQS